MSHYLEELYSLKGKTAVVIGGTGELCGAMAHGLAQAGASAVLVGRDQQKADAKLQQIEADGGSAYFAACDICDADSIQQLLATIVERSGAVDILVNGAGLNAATPFLEISSDEFDKLVEVNLKAVFTACQTFGDYFVQQGIEASVINVGSMSGVIPLSRVFTYSLAKAAVHNLTKNLAREWAPHGIRVNTLVPGFFPTELNRKLLSKERTASILQHTPMGRFGDSHELIGATLLLASDQAGSFITGHELVVDGGFSAMTI